MFGCFKEKQINSKVQNVSEEEELEEKIFFVNVEIPTILSPMGDRADAEDLIDDFLQENNLGEVDGGGTHLPSEGFDGSSEITIVLKELNINHYKRLAKFIKENIQLPKGSKLRAERENYYSDEELKGFDDIELS